MAGQQRTGKTFPVTGPDGQSMNVRFFSDGSVRFLLKKAGPMLVRYAFLPGKEQNVILELKPEKGSLWAKS